MGETVAVCVPLVPRFSTLVMGMGCVTAKVTVRMLVTVIVVVTVEGPAVSVDVCVSVAVLFRWSV